MAQEALAGDQEVDNYCNYQAAREVPEVRHRAADTIRSDPRKRCCYCLNRSLVSPGTLARPAGAVEPVPLFSFSSALPPATLLKSVIRVILNSEPHTDTKSQNFSKNKIFKKFCDIEIRIFIK